ncbi:MAG: hypothetical protein HY774_02780 [Acidobacteria bacterium]|nr:hypothetical protein [Acidobacteriota bacterium]
MPVTPLPKRSLFPSVYEHELTSFGHQLARVLFLKYALLFLTIWTFGYGILVLAIRVAASHLPRTWLAWGLLGVIPVLIAAVVAARKQIPPIEKLRAVLDRESACGGLLMASHETKLEGWDGYVPRLTLPQVAWEGQRVLSMCGIGLVFLAASFLVPISSTVLGMNQSLDVGKEVSQLNEQIETLKEEKLIDEPKAEALEEQLSKIQQEAKGDDPAKTLEAIDHLDENLKKTAQEAAEKDVQATERLSQQEALAETLSKEGSQMDDQLLAEATEELAEMAKESLGENAPESQALNQQLSQNLKKALDSGKLTPEELKELAKALKNSKQSLADQLKKLKESGLIDQKTLSQCEKAGQCNSQGLKDFLEKNKGEGKGNGSGKSVKESMKEWGRGGTSRGRGDAPMSWTEGTNEDGAKFKEQTLPSNSLNPEDSQMIGLSVSEPKIENAGPQTGGALAGSNAGNASANTQKILPRHKGAVKRYFERKNE